MSRSVVSRGKSVNEAVKLGLNLLNTTKRDVDIEIISAERKGVLGIGSKPAVVKLIIKKNSEEIYDMNIESLLASSARDKVTPLAMKDEKTVELTGKVWVSNGTILCKNSTNQYPSITPMKGITLYKNGQPFNDTVIITEGDTIEVDLRSVKEETSWEVTIDEKKLQAKLHVKPGKETTLILPDQSPQEHLQLTVNETVTSFNQLKPEDIITQLSNLGVIYGINYSEIFDACKSVREGEYIIASGLEPQEGKNGYIDFCVSLNDGIITFGDEDNTIDFREIRNIPSVKKGDVIAKYFNPTQGKPGVSITGEAIIPDPVYPVSIQLGKGVTIIEEDMAVVAISPGRPQVQSRGLLVKVSVLPKLLHESDVDLSSGNIRFTGDVEITGEIQEDMEVAGKGSVFVHGMVNRAKVTAGSSLFIKNNVIGSDISAGNSNLAISEVKQNLAMIVPQLDDIISAIKQLYRSPVFKMSDFNKMGMSSLIRILLESKFKSFNSIVKKFVIKVQSQPHAFDEEWQHMSDRLYRSFLMLHPHELRDLTDLERLKNEADELLQLSECPVVPNCSLTIPYALNSKLFSSGDINVTGQGCYHTKMYANGFVKVTGFLRGGEVFADKGVEIGEAGANGGVPTIIKVGSSETIKIEKVFEDTTIVIGKKRHKFSSPRENVIARLDENEQIKFF